MQTRPVRASILARLSRGTAPGCELPPRGAGVDHLGVGYVAGGTGAAVVYPIDVVKVRPGAGPRLRPAAAPLGRAPSARLSAAPAFSSAQTRLQAAPVGRYRGPLDCAWQTMEEGSMYDGFPAQLLGVAPEKMLKLAAYTAALPHAYGLLAGDGAAPGAAPYEDSTGEPMRGTLMVITKPLVRVFARSRAGCRAVARREVRRARREMPLHAKKSVQYLCEDNVRQRHFAISETGAIRLC